MDFTAATSCPLPSPTLRQIPAQTLWASPTAVPVEVVTGRAWITQAGDPQDHVVEAGDIWRPRGQGRVVVQALDGWLVIMILGRSSRPASEPDFFRGLGRHNDRTYRPRWRSLLR